MNPLIYLDNGATTPIDPEIIAGLATRQAELFGNPESSHPLGRAAQRAHREARARLAQQLGGKAEEIVFTSGGTEAIGLAIYGLVGAQPGHIVHSNVAHSCIREPAQWLAENRGWAVGVVRADEQGRVWPEALHETLRTDTRVVVLMLANNEVGCINDVAALAEVVRRRAPRAKLVLDAVQAFGKIPVDVRALDVDCLAITAHKLHGPKGIGALWTRVPLRPIMRGGGQEGGRRGGTQSAPLAWALAEAGARQFAGMKHVTALRDRLYAGVLAALPEVRLTGPEPGPWRLGNHLHICVPGVPGEPLLNALAAAGVCASAGSACSTGKFSPILTAIGRSERDGGYLRFTTGRFNTAKEVDAAVAHLASAVAELRSTYQ